MPLMRVSKVRGGVERDRTADLLVANEALSQLSYNPTPFAFARYRKLDRYKSRSDATLSVAAMWLRNKE